MARLKSLITVQNGFAFDSKFFTEGEGKPLLRIRDLNTVSTQIRYSGKYKAAYLVKQCDLLVGMDGDFETVQWKGEEALLNQRVCRITSKSPDELSQGYLFYRIIDEIKAINNQVSATTVKHLSSRDIENIDIELPTLPEQESIAAVLCVMERAIEHTEAVIAKQQRIKTGLMHDLLTKGIDKQGQLRSEVTHEFKDSPLGRIPNDWDVYPLSQIAELQVGYAFKSASFSEGGLRLLRGENVGYGKPDWKDIRYLPERLAEGFSDYILRDGDLVIGMDRTFTKSGVKISKLANEDVPSLLVQRVGRFLASGCDASFLTLLVSQSEYLFALRNKEKGMDIPHLSKTEILSPLVRVPPESEQKRIAKRGEIVSKSIQSLRNDLAKLLRLKVGLMLDLLTGRVPVEALIGNCDDGETLYEGASN